MLSLQDVRRFAKGVISVSEEDGYFCFYRFTEAQIATMIRRNFPPHQNSTAGIRLEFLTRGGALSLTYQVVPGSGLDFYEFDITLDGNNIYHVFHNGLPHGDRVELTIPQSDVSQKVSIYLTNISCMRLRDVTFPADAAPVERTRKILMTGDSITHGYDAHHTNLAYANLAADLLDMDLLNQGVGGDVFCADNIDPDLPYRPDIITVAYGTNDWAGGRLIPTGEAERYLEKLTKSFPGVPVLLLLPLWRSGETEPHNGYTLEDCRAYLRRIAAPYETVRVVSQQALVPKLPEFYSDGLHPNDLGFMYFGYHLSRIIEETLRQGAAGPSEK